MLIKTLKWILLLTLSIFAIPALASDIKEITTQQPYVVALNSPPQGLKQARGEVFNPNIALGQSIALKSGISGREWKCLDNLVKIESNWSETAENKTSHAFGIFQFLNSTWAGTGITKSTDPVIQINAGLVYIKNRYNTPCEAYKFQTSHIPYWY